MKIEPVSQATVNLRKAFRGGVLLQANHDFQIYGNTTLVTQHLPDKLVDKELRDLSLLDDLTDEEVRQLNEEKSHD